MKIDEFVYLESIHLEETTLSNERLKTILIASILRYFEGIRSIEFIIDLSSAISEQKDLHLEDELLTATLLIKFIQYQMEFDNINKNVIQKRLHHVLDKLTI